MDKDNTTLLLGVTVLAAAAVAALCISNALLAMLGTPSVLRVLFTVIAMYMVAHSLYAIVIVYNDERECSDNDTCSSDTRSNDNDND